MASSFIYTKAKNSVLNGSFNFASDTLKFMLLTSSYTPSQDNDGVYSDISANEVSGTGYTAGGVTLSGVTVTKTLANSWSATWAANTAYTVGKIVIPVTPNGFVYRCVSAGTSGGGVAPTVGTNASPIVVTAAAHGLATGNAITIASVTGNTNMNAASLAVVQSSSTYNLMNPATLVLVNGNGTFGGSPTIVPTWSTTIGVSFTDGTVTWTCAGESVITVTATSPQWTSATFIGQYGVCYDSTAGNKLISLFNNGSNYSVTANTFTFTLDSVDGLFNQA